MALTGIQIYKLLPQTNCKECGFPTCLAFAMKLAAKQVELSACPYVSEEAKRQLAESAAPPIRLVSLRSAAQEVKAGNETCLFRHEKTFYNRPGVFLHLRLSDAGWKETLQRAAAWKINYVGVELGLDGFAVEIGGEESAAAIRELRALVAHPLILIGKEPAALRVTLDVLRGETPLLYAAEASNWETMADLAKEYHAALTVRAEDLDSLADLTQKVQGRGVEDLVLDLGTSQLGPWLTRSTIVRRMALKNFRPFGYPVLAWRTEPPPEMESLFIAQAIAKYAGFVIVNTFAPEMLYPLLVLRQNIYTDPQKPIQVQPGLYEINAPKPDSPVLVTTNFSITYFSVANEVEGSGLPAWLVVTDAEGMSVLTAWAAGKFDAERIAKAIRTFEVDGKVTRKRLVIPGHVAVLSGELEEELPDWEIRVGPREAVDIPAFIRQALN